MPCPSLGDSFATSADATSLVQRRQNLSVPASPLDQLCCSQSNSRRCTLGWAEAGSAQRLRLHPIQHNQSLPISSARAQQPHIQQICCWETPVWLVLKATVGVAPFKDKLKGPVSFCSKVAVTGERPEEQPARPSGKPEVAEAEDQKHWEQRHLAGGCTLARH